MPAAGERLVSAQQFAAIDALSAEEINLADELRGAISERDPDALVQLLTALGTFWALRGEHPRLIVLVDAVADLVSGWRPPPELEDLTRGAMAMLLTNAMIIGNERTGSIWSLLRELGPGTGATRT